MRIVRHILILCLALGLIANGLSPAHAMPCASASDAGGMSDSAHRHADMADHAAHMGAFDHGDGVTAASPDRAVDHGGHDAAGPACNCGCLSLCGVVDATPLRAEALERRTIDIRYTVAAQGAPGSIPFIDPGIPILAA